MFQMKRITPPYKKYKQALNYYKNGYMKLPEGDPNADAYYENIERVLNKRDGVIDDSENETDKQ